MSTTRVIRRQPVYRVVRSFQGRPGESATPPPGTYVETVFGRSGPAVVAQAPDYASFYDTLGSAQAVEDTKGQANGICPLGADGKIPPEFAAATLNLRGAWDAATNDPDIGALGDLADGDFWIVDVAGSTDLNGITSWAVGDWALWSANQPGNWIKVAIGNQVSSVFGRVGAVVAQSGDYHASLVDATAVGHVYMPGANVQAQLSQADGALSVLNSELQAHRNDIGDHVDVTYKATRVENDVLVWQGSSYSQQQLAAEQVKAVPSANYLTGDNVQAQLDQAESRLIANDAQLAFHVVSLDRHSDCAIENPQIGNILIYNGSVFASGVLTAQYVAVDPLPNIAGDNVQIVLGLIDNAIDALQQFEAEHRPTIADHGDVNVASPSDGEVLIYRAGAWINDQPEAPSSIPATSITAIASPNYLTGANVQEQLTQADAQLKDNRDTTDAHIADASIHRPAIITLPDAEAIEGDHYFRLDQAGVERRLSVRDLAQSLIARALLAGDANSFGLGGSITTITGYAASWASETYIDGGGSVTPANGIIVAPVTGAYNVVCNIIGQQGNDNKEEAMFLWVRSNLQGDFRVGALEVATDKTDWRQMSASITLLLTAGEQISLGMSATTGLGTFNFEDTELAVEFLTSEGVS